MHWRGALVFSGSLGGQREKTPCGICNDGGMTDTRRVGINVLCILKSGMHCRRGSEGTNVKFSTTSSHASKFHDFPKSSSHLPYLSNGISSPIGVRRPRLPRSLVSSRLVQHRMLDPAGRRRPYVAWTGACLLVMSWACLYVLRFSG